MEAIGAVSRIASEHSFGVIGLVRNTLMLKKPTFIPLTNMETPFGATDGDSEFGWDAE